MMRSPYLAEDSVERTMTMSPGSTGLVELATPEPAINDTVYEDPMDDVFGSDDNEVHVGQEDQNTGPNLQSVRTTHGEHMDASRLRSTHVTNGYREGLTESKTQYVQEGFDEGYSLGAVIGSKAGWCLGVLESICRVIISHEAQAERSTNDGNQSQRGTTIDTLNASLDQARKDLALQSLFSPTFFGSDGIWLYEVAGQGDENNVTFQHVADTHPLILKWKTFVANLANELGLKFGSTKEYVRLGEIAEGD